MWSFWKYTYVYVTKRKSTWITAGILWLYVGLIVVLVPWLLNLSPLTIWNNTVYDIRTFNIIILSIFCGVTTVLVFREGKDDGNELLIAAKPINRWKVVFCKFTVYLLHSLLIILLAVVIMLFAFCFGKVSSANPHGLDEMLFIKTIAAFILGSIVIVLIFSAIAIIVSMITGKIVILVTTIGLAVIFNVLHMIMPALSKSEASYINENYGIDLKSTRYFDVNSQLQGNSVTISDVGENDVTYYAGIAKEHSTNAVAAYLDVASGLSNLYQSFGATDQATIDNSSYGSSNRQDYILDNSASVLENGKRPMLFLAPQNDQINYRNIITYHVFGIDLDTLPIYALGGIDSTTIAITMDKSENLLVEIRGVHAYNGDDIYNNNFTNPSLNPAFQDVLDTAWQQVGPIPNGNQKTNISVGLIHNFIEKTVFQNWLGPTPSTKFGQDKNLTFAKVMLGEEVNYDNPNQATQQLNLICMRFYGALLKKYSLALYEHEYIDTNNHFDEQTIWTEFGDQNTAQWRNIFEYGPQFLYNDDAWTCTSDAPYVALDSTRAFKFFTNDFIATKSLLTMHDYISKPYVNNINFIISWSGISLVLFGATVVVYTRTDFK